MSKKSSKRKKTASKKKGSRPRKGKKAPFKQHGTRGVRASQARANKAKRARKAKNAKASGKARRFGGVSIPVPAGYKGPLPGVSGAGVALTPAARKRARKAAAASVASGTATLTVPIPAGYTGALPGVSAGIAKPAKKRRKKASGSPSAGKKRRGKKRSKKAASSAAPAAAAKKTRRRSGRAKPGSIQKMKLMHKWGFPRGTRAAISKVRKGELREAAGGRITFPQIMQTIRNEKLKSWVCVGPRRSGCGGGAKNLRGGHQIGIFGTLHR